MFSPGYEKLHDREELLLLIFKWSNAIDVM